MATPITIAGITLTAVNLSRDSESTQKITGSFHLMSSTGKVLAKQTFNNYSDIAGTWSPATLQARDALEAAVKADIEATLGLAQ